jgi:hypothetical protein
MRAVVLGKVPNTNTSSTITSNDFALVRVNDYISDWVAMGIASLNRTTSSLPNLDRAVLRACNHPLSLAVKCDTCNVACMSFKSEEGVWVGGFDVVELDSMMASSGEEALVWRYAETVDLRVRVLNCTRADTRKCLPEAESLSC